MSKKTALLAVSLIALATLAFMPMAELQADDEEDPILLIATENMEDGMMYITSEGEEEGGNNLFYDCLITIIVALALMGLLHVVDRSRKAKQ